MVSSRFNASRRSLLRKEKVIPRQQLGVIALPTSNQTMKGVLEWLKTERLHKYWPVFSRMSYSTLVSLNEENMDYALQCIGSSPITNGARGRILRCTEKLRERSSRLNAINEKTSLYDIAEVFELVALTPLSATENEPDGENLVRLFRQKLNQVVGFHGADIVKNSKLTLALRIYSSRLEVPEEDKIYIERLLNNLMAASFSSFRRSSPPVKSPPSSPPSSQGSSSSESPHCQHNLVHVPVFPLRQNLLHPIYCPYYGVPFQNTSPVRPATLVEKMASGEKTVYPGFNQPLPGLKSRQSNVFSHTKPAMDVPRNGIDTISQQESTIRRPLFDRHPTKKTPTCHQNTRPSSVSSASVLQSSDGPGANGDDLDSLGTALQNHSDLDLFSSIGATIDSLLDLNKIWGGRTNQVIFDLNVTPR